MIRNDFPLIKHPPYAQLCYVDNASTTQMPKVTIEAMKEYAQESHANIHRAPYRLAEIATSQYERARDLLAKRYSVKREGVVITHGATESLNLLARSISQTLEQGDGILLSYLDHHSMIVPWQLAAKEKGLVIHWAALTPDGTIDCDAVKNIIRINPNIKVMSIIGASNVIGTYQPIKTLTAIAQEHNIITIVDGCQMGLDLVQLNLLKCDFWVISAHKMFGPTGIGAVITTNPDWWDMLPPYQSGGGMITMVTSTDTCFQSGYAKFEAGTPPIQAAHGWAESLEYIIEKNSLELIEEFNSLVSYALDQFSSIKGYKLLFAHNSKRTGVFSFTHDTIHPHDLATYLDHLHGVSARAGHHCAMPLMDYLGINATLRLSITWYNTRAEIDQCVKALEGATEFFNV